MFKKQSLSRRAFSGVIAAAMVLSLMCGVTPIRAHAADGLIAAEDVPVSQQAMEPITLVDNGSASMTITSYDPNGEYGPTCTVALENKTPDKVYFMFSDVSVNGYMCDPVWGTSVEAGQNATSTIEWDEDQMAECGVNYLQDVEGLLWIYSEDVYTEGDIFYDTVSFSLDPVDPSLPVISAPAATNGFEPISIVEGDVDVSVVGYDPEGTYGPSLTILTENHRDGKVTLSISDVMVNGVSCDPYWSTDVSAGMASYSSCEWWDSDLEMNNITSIETVDFNLTVMDFDSFNVLTQNEISLQLDELTATSNETYRNYPGEYDPASEAAGVMESDNIWSNDYFGIRAVFPSGWSFMPMSQLLMAQSFTVDTEEMEESEAIDALLESNNTALVMQASSEDSTLGASVTLMRTAGTSYANMTEEQLADVLFDFSALEEETKGTLDSLGLAASSVTIEPVPFAGSEHVGVSLNMPLSTGEITENMVILKEGDYCMLINASDMGDGSHISDILAYFTSTD